MPDRFRGRPRSFRIYTVVLLCLSIPLFAWAIPISHPAIVMWLIVIFAAACIVKPIPHPYGGFIYSTSAIVQVAGLLWEPQDAFLGVGVGCFLGQLTLQRRGLWMSGLNAAGWAMAALAASAVAHLVLASVSFLPLSLILAAVLSVGARFVTNQVIFSGYRSLRFGHPFFLLLRDSLAGGVIGEFFPIPMIIILAGTAFLLPATAWRLVITAAYIPVLPIPRKRCDYSGSRDLLDDVVDDALRRISAPPAARSQAQAAMAFEAFHGPAAVPPMGARILAAAELFDKTCSTLSPTPGAAASQAVELQLAALAESAQDPLIVPTVVRVGSELRSTMIDKPG